MSLRERLGNVEVRPERDGWRIDHLPPDDRSVWVFRMPDEIGGGWDFHTDLGNVSSGGYETLDEALAYALALSIVGLHEELQTPEADR